MISYLKKALWICLTLIVLRFTMVFGDTCVVSQLHPNAFDEKGLGIEKRPFISDPLHIVKIIADRFIDETNFKFELVPLQEANGLYFVDFRKNYGSPSNSTAYGLTFIEAAEDTTITFGISYCQQIRIWINDRVVFDGAPKETYRIKEYTYDRFYFDHLFQARIRKGLNKMLVKVASQSDDWIFFIRPVDKYGIYPSMDCSDRFMKVFGYRRTIPT